MPSEANISPNFRTFDLKESSYNIADYICNMNINLDSRKDAYKNAVEFFLKQENSTQVQNAQYTKSFGVEIEPWLIELHGTLRNPSLCNSCTVLHRDRCQNDRGRSP